LWPASAARALSIRTISQKLLAAFLILIQTENGFNFKQQKTPVWTRQLKLQFRQLERSSNVSNGRVTKEGLVLEALA
jgi:hypothetical protein